jgi:DNA polymerase-1
MLVNADVKGLEVVVAAELSDDPVLKQEVRDGVDIHEINRDRFNLGEGKAGRLIAKIFKFRLIYGGSAYSYAHDSDFMGVSTSEKFWQGVIDEYYAKYKGIRKWHDWLIDYAKRNGQLEIPSGRFFPIEPDYSKKGEPWPITVIKNYPVQGFGADLVMLARLEAAKRLRGLGLQSLLISTIHDSIVADCPDDEIEIVAKILHDSIAAVPDLCRKAYKYDFSLPMSSEIQYGLNKKDMKTLYKDGVWSDLDLTFA